MRKFVAGFVAGTLFATATMALAAKVVGNNGHLLGWSVTVDGEEVCDSPYVWQSLREIECD